MSKMTPTQFTPEEWQTLYELLCCKIQSRIELMQGILQMRYESGSGADVSPLQLEGILYMVEEMREQLREAINIMNM
jgi:hypothetical protein